MFGRYRLIARSLVLLTWGLLSWTLDAASVPSSGSGSLGETNQAAHGPLPSQLWQVSVAVYDAAGVRIKDLYSGTVEAVPVSVSATGLFMPGPGAAVTLELNGTALQLHGTGSLAWSGDDNTGQIVPEGHFYFKAEFRSASGETTALIAPVDLRHSFKATDPKLIQVASGAAVGTDPAPILGPNPAGTASSDVEVSYHVQPSCWAYVRVFNEAGELVARGADTAGTGRIILRCGTLAAGIYEVEFELRDGSGVVDRRLLKLAVAH